MQGSIDLKAHCTLTSPIHAHLSDGALDLILIRATPELTKAKLISLLLQTETGKCILEEGGGEKIYSDNIGFH